jgi:hypothetical protein
LQDTLGVQENLGCPTALDASANATFNSALQNNAQRLWIPLGRRFEAKLQRIGDLFTYGCVLERQNEFVQPALPDPFEMQKLGHVEGDDGEKRIDLLHVACALLFESEVFLTSDQRQAALGKAEGLQVTLVRATD